MKYNIKYSKIIFSILLFIPLLLIAQATGNGNETIVAGFREGDYAQGMKFLQGDDILESWFIDSFIGSLDAFARDNYSVFIYWGQSIGGICALLYLGNIGWSMLAGDKKWEIMPMLRPMVFAIIIANWLPLVKGAQEPFRNLGDFGKQKVKTMQADLTQERLKRFKAQNKLMDAILNAKIEAIAAAQALEEEQESGNSLGLIGEAWDWTVDAVGGSPIDNMSAWITSMYLKLEFNLQLVLAGLLESLGLLLLRLMAYGMLFVGEILSIFLIIIGPLSMGFSVLPAFNSSWKQWFSKFVGVQFWPALIYAIMQMGILLQLGAVQSEIDRYEQMIDTTTGAPKSLELITAFGNSGAMTFGILILAYILSGIGLLLVPTLSSWILGTASSTGGVTAKAGAYMAGKVF